MRLAVLVTLLCSLAVCDAYKYLVASPFFGHSHCNFLGKLADILTEAGHEVHMFMPVFDDSLVNKTGVKLTKRVEIYEGDVRALKMYDDMRNGMMKNLWTVPVDPISMTKMMGNMTQMWAFNCEKMANDVDLHKRLKAENYDAGIGEPFIFCPIALMDQIGIRTIIGALSTYQIDTVARAMGEPPAPSYVPSMQSSEGEKMNIIERMKNAFGSTMGAHIFGSMNQAELDVINKKFNSDRKYEDIIGDMPLVFTNNNPYLNYARPMIAKNVQIGGITVHTKAKPLDKELSDVLNLRKHTVYISFGSVAKSKDMPEQYRDSLVSVMESMPDVTFIWKYEEKTNCVDHLKNVILSPWLPQTDLLADPRLSLFITHGGLGSITEVAYMGKPTIMELSDVLNLRKHTVYISFGSVAKSKDMPEQYRDSLVSVMESMPDVTFIWKYEEKTNCVDHLKNVILSPWLPQTDLLADPRLSLFITHGGLGSITEVAYMGKPTIMIPIFAEQPRNAAMLARHGCGIPLKKEDLADGKRIKEAIETILSDDSYAKSAKALAEIMNSPPIEPKQIFLKHTEFATRVGKLPQLDPYGRHLSLIQYYLIDVFALVATVILLFITFIIFVIRFAIRKCCAKISKAKKE